MWLTNGARAGRRRHPGEDRRGRRFRLQEHDDASSSRRSRASATQGGVTIPGKIEKMGYKGVETTEMVLDGARVPAAAILGGDAGRGRGFYQMMDGVEVGRVNVAARGCGIMTPRVRARDRVRAAAPDLRQADRRPPGHRLQARRDGDQGRGGAPDDGQRRPAQGRGQAQRRRGRHGQATWPASTAYEVTTESRSASTAGTAIPRNTRSSGSSGRRRSCSSVRARREIQKTIISRGLMREYKLTQ